MKNHRPFAGFRVDEPIVDPHAGIRVDDTIVDPTSTSRWDAADAWSAGPAPQPDDRSGYPSDRPTPYATAAGEYCAIHGAWHLKLAATFAAER